ETMEHSIELLRAAGATRYVLEVLEPNTAAATLYRSLGFAETRMLDCYTIIPSPLRGEGRVRGESGATVAPHPGPLPAQRGEGTDWWDIQPSWQNSTASIQRARDPHLFLGDDDGYAILFPSTGDVPQLAVRREARRRGVGTRLVETAAAIAQKPLRFINVDSRDAGIAAFLAALGAKRFVRQMEMEFVIQPAPL
ncbi:MAG: GNAT family N-acetyltransferase, partial [Vicinamibacterales bacterium]